MWPLRPLPTKSAGKCALNSLRCPAVHQNERRGGMPVGYIGDGSQVKVRQVAVTSLFRTDDDIDRPIVAGAAAGTLDSVLAAHTNMGFNRLGAGVTVIIGRPDW
jgi:hypothetical protein